MTARRPSIGELQELVRGMLLIMKRIYQPGTTMEEARNLVSGLAILNPDDIVPAGTGTWQADEKEGVKLTFEIAQKLAQLSAAEDIYVEALEDLYQAVDKMATGGRRLPKDIIDAIDQIAVARAEVRRYRGDGEKE